MEMVKVFEQLFENRQLGAVGANVVDDTENVVIHAPSPDEFPWWIVAVVAGVAIIGTVAFVMFRK